MYCVVTRVRTDSKWKGKPLLPMVREYAKQVHETRISHGITRRDTLVMIQRKFQSALAAEKREIDHMKATIEEMQEYTEWYIGFINKFFNPPVKEA